MSLWAIRYIVLFAGVEWLVGFGCFWRMRSDLNACDIPWARRSFWDKNWQPEVLKLHKSHLPASRLRTVYYVSAVLFASTLALGALYSRLI